MSEVRQDEAQPQKPGMSWDDAEDESGSDFLDNLEGHAVPKACALDEPDCTACQ